jgi:hypothetical protein
VIAGAALCCMAVLASACGSASSPSSEPTRTVTATVTPSAPASTSPGPSSSPTAPSAPAACLSRYLGAKVGLTQGTAGSSYIVLDFTNLGTVSCTLYGYPGVSLAGGKPVTQIGLAATESDTSPRQLVTLAPGAVGNALLRITDADNFPPGRCHPVTSTFLQIYPPNQTVPIYLGFRSRACAKPVRLLTIGVVQPGSGGSS